MYATKGSDRRCRAHNDVDAHNLKRHTYIPRINRRSSSCISVCQFVNLDNPRGCAFTLTLAVMLSKMQVDDPPAPIPQRPSRYGVNGISSDHAVPRWQWRRPHPPFLAIHWRDPGWCQCCAGTAAKPRTPCEQSSTPHHSHTITAPPRALSTKP